MAKRRRHGRGSLMTATINLMRRSEQSTTDISVATGIAVDWLNRFRGNRIDDPGVNRVEVLYCYLSGKQLRVEA